VRAVVAAPLHVRKPSSTIPFLRNFELEFESVDAILARRLGAYWFDLGIRQRRHAEDGSLARKSSDQNNC